MSTIPSSLCHVDQAKRVETSHKCALDAKRLKPQRFLDYARNDKGGESGWGRSPNRLIALAWIMFAPLAAALR